MCTSIRFTDNSGHMYLGRNLDWSFDYGQQVRVMPRGFHIPYSFIDDATAAHAVIGMSIDYRLCRVCQGPCRRQDQYRGL